MTHPLSILRLALMAIIGLAATNLILSVPTFADIPTSLLELLEKAAGAALLLLDGHLYRRWSVTDPLVKAYDQWCDRLAAR